MSSVNFPNPLNSEQISFMLEMLGRPDAHDGQTFLFSSQSISNANRLANVVQQPVAVELHAEGEIKTMADGTQYRVTRSGWRKVSNG